MNTILTRMRGEVALMGDTENRRVFLKAIEDMEEWCRNLSIRTNPTDMAQVMRSAERLWLRLGSVYELATGKQLHPKAKTGVQTGLKNLLG